MTRSKTLGILAAPGAVCLLALTWLGLDSSGRLSGQDAPNAPQSQASLKRMLTITWKKGPHLPQGFQDSDGGILHDTLITVGGFCGGQQVPGKVGKHPRGFLKKVWGLDLMDPQKGWQALPEFPGTARQELFSIVIDNRLYCWGGFSYSAPYCYKDGFRLSKSRGAWKWERLPDLPWVNAAAGISAIGSKIFVIGGTDYDGSKEGKFYTNSDRQGKVPRLGARLLVMDTKDLERGWQELLPCPGTPRWVHAAAAVNGKLYVIGGATGNDNPVGPKGDKADSGSHTVVDNWRYDPVTAKWDRLRDTPVATGNFPSGQIVYKDRYILLIGGYQYPRILDPKGASRPAYGKVTKHYANKDYCSDVFVFDAQTQTFGTATPLPLNNNLPMTVVAGDRLHLIGGETAGSVIEAEEFGHHPDLYLVGTIKEGQK